MEACFVPSTCFIRKCHKSKMLSSRTKTLKYFNRSNFHVSNKANAEVTIPSEVQNWLKSPRHLLIDGKWVPSVCCTLYIRIQCPLIRQVSGKTFEVIDPSTEEVISRVADGSPADVDKAVAAARKVCTD